MVVILALYINSYLYAVQAFPYFFILLASSTCTGTCTGTRIGTMPGCTLEWTRAQHLKLGYHAGGREQSCWHLQHTMQCTVATVASSGFPCCVLQGWIHCAVLGDAEMLCRDDLCCCCAVYAVMSDVQMLLLQSPQRAHESRTFSCS